MIDIRRSTVNRPRSGLRISGKVRRGNASSVVCGAHGQMFSIERLDNFRSQVGFDLHNIGVLMPENRQNTLPLPRTTSSFSLFVI